MKKNYIVEIALGVSLILCGITTIIINKPVSAIGNGFTNICFGICSILWILTLNKVIKS